MASSGGASKDDGVFQLITELCTSVATKYTSQKRLSQKLLASKMRTHAYEIILKKTTTEIPCTNRNPVVDLLSYYLVSQQSAKNVAEYRRCVELKKVISTIRHKDFGENKDNVHSVLKFLVSLSNSVQEDLSPEMYQKPFSFGLFEEMLPKPPREVFGSPQPYSYFPSHVFELPYSLRSQGRILDRHKSQTYTEYTVESFDSRSYVGDTVSQLQRSSDVKTFLSPMSLASMTSTHLSPYSESGVFKYPRLTAPRDLQIPSLIDKPNVKISFTSSSAKSDVQDLFRANTDEDSLDIWELATQVDKEVPNNIWEVVSKMPPIIERQLIASSSREVALWRRLHADRLADLMVITEKQFIRHLMYLVIGIETSSFPYSEESKCFYMKKDLALEGVSPQRLGSYVSGLLLTGTYYKSLYRFAFNQSLDDDFQSQGLVYEAAREVVRQYLLDFRLVATEIYEECIKNSTEDLNCMPTLLQILHHMEALKYEIETVVSIYKTNEPETQPSLPRGAELMSYLFNEISLVTHKSTAHTMFTSLFSICKVYFKFIERFIFEGELDDQFNEFFIRKDSQYVNCRSKRYWDKGFHITQSVAVPEFLRPLAKFILLCGKSLRLLKLCNPNDPLVLLISSDHPSIKCCSSFEELSRQQQLLDVYRTRCLFVSGEPATFDQILLKREAERKAFTEMASVKQAETFEKIVAERKRLAQLIIAEKQHSLRVLEAAMAEAKAAKQKARQRERRRFQLEKEAEKATEEVDAKLRDDERNKIMEYYSKLNMEVEKSKIHTEWKIKRLQLDQSRMQLLSTEERNLKREKLELEHQKNGEMAMSISLDYNTNIESTEDGDKADNGLKADNTAPTVVEDIGESSKPSNDVLSVICNAAKSIFSIKKADDDKNCDNKKNLDAQGNIVCGDTEVNSNENETVTSSGEIGHKLNENYDNLQFLKQRQEAISNKKKVMSHEFGQVDNENNRMKYQSNVDEENNAEWSTFAQARRNKLKVLGDEFNLKPEIKIVAEPKTDAQKEALINKLKILGDEFGLSPEAKLVTVPKTDAQKEALINKLKVLGDEFGLKPEAKLLNEPKTDAQKEAVINRQKVLGVEYNLPLGIAIRNEPANIAQEEALRNKIKVLGSDYDTRKDELPKRDTAKRSGLTLNLKPYSESSESNLGITPNTGAITPGELFPRLDLETPTTADVLLETAIMGDAFTPRSDFSKDMESSNKVDKEFSTDGFNFPVMVDENDDVGTDTISEVQTDGSPGNSPSKNRYDITPFKRHYSFFDLLDGSYSLNEFDPFGVKELKKYSKDFFSSRMDVEMMSSCYTHPAVTMDEVKKKPYPNIFASHFATEEDKDQKINSDNIATLTACLQRSVMLPLTYQLEVVNNSILTHFLVNLDMYEHLRSLKDYFFLMDGEFSRSICHNLFTKLAKTVNPQELLNFATLHNILDKALGSSISHVHKFSENLSFSLSETPLCVQHSSPDALQCVALSYQVRWPLNIILSQEALLRYARVFQFLLKMRRIFWVLSEDFELLKLSVKLSKEHSRKLLRSPQYISIQIYRHNMASMIRALDNYIVTTCILTSWNEFETDLRKARTLDDLYDCHVVYIKKVLFRCLLNNRSTPVMKLLNDIFTVILKFSRVLKAGEWQQLDPTGYFIHSSFGQLEELFHLFEKLAKYLHKVVTKLMECGYQRHLVELLAMVNLNGYYEPEKSKEDPNMAFMMPVVKNDWDIYNSRSRRTSESVEKVGRVRKVSESRSEGPSLGPGRLALSPHRSTPAMRSLSYCRAPPSRASLRAADSPKSSGSPTQQPEKFHNRARAASPGRSRCAGCMPYL